MVVATSMIVGGIRITVMQIEVVPNDIAFMLPGNRYEFINKKNIKRYTETMANEKGDHR